MIEYNPAYCLCKLDLDYRKERNYPPRIFHRRAGCLDCSGTDVTHHCFKHLDKLIQEIESLKRVWE